jgi:hypothetical protein
MSKTYIFIPVDKNSLAPKDVEDLSSRAHDLSHIKKHRRPKIIWADDKQASKMLRSLTDEDRLYISAHGNAESIGTEGNAVELSPAQLANLLETNGVPKDITDIRVFACHSAESSNPDQESIEVYFVPDEEKLREQTYAGKLATQLENLGYKNAVVRGYMGAIHYIKSRNGTDGPYLAKEFKDDEGQRAEFFKGDDFENLRPSQGSFRFRNSESDKSTLADDLNKNSENLKRRMPPEEEKPKKKRNKR